MGYTFKSGHRLPRKSRNLKTVLVDEQRRSSEAPMGEPTYLNIDAPPPLVPIKHWCDITGLPAPYRNATGMRFHNREIFDIVQSLPPGVEQEYLKLRNANVVLR